MTNQLPRNYPSGLRELADIVHAALLKGGIESDRAGHLANLVIDRIRHELGGQKLYVPTGKALDVERARRVVLERWNGTNTRELCRELGISESRLRQIYNEAKGS